MRSPRRSPPRPPPIPLAPEEPLPATWWADADYHYSPSAQVESVSTLLDGLRRGDYRIPPFQRRFVWTDDDVITLLDSLLRSYHVGTLITWEQFDMPATVEHFGRARIPLPAGRAQLVLDGQQRLGALATAFLAPGFACDLRAGRFFTTEEGEPLRPGCFPLPMVLDTCALLDWARENASSALGRQDFRLAARLAQILTRAKVPVVKLPADWTAAEAVEMFRRLNTAGVRMAEEDLETILRTYGSPTEGRAP